MSPTCWPTDPLIALCSSTYSTLPRRRPAAVPLASLPRRSRLDGDWRPLAPAVPHVSSDPVPMTDTAGFLQLYNQPGLAVYVTHRACATVLAPACCHGYQVTSRLATGCQSTPNWPESAAPRCDTVPVTSVETRDSLDPRRTRLDGSGTLSSPHTEDDTVPVTIHSSVKYDVQKSTSTQTKLN